jgi:hypothetical protein
MHIEINGESERLIQAGLASGEFHTAEEAIAAMARAWAAARQPSTVSIPRMKASTDIRALAAEQGVRPFDASARKPDFWPADESADQFLAFLHETRNDEAGTR